MSEVNAAVDSKKDGSDEFNTENCKCEETGTSGDKAAENKDGSAYDNCSSADEKQDESHEEPEQSSEINSEIQDDGEIEKEDVEEAWQEKYVRLYAEFQNFKKRSERDRAQIYQMANEDLIKDLLTVIDNLERALVQEDTADKGLLDGIRLVHKQYIDILTKHGLSAIDPIGCEFDPREHQAIMMEEKEGFKQNQVTEVLQKGYSLKGKVLRPAMVKVHQ